jgi:hypothetical protein
MRARLCVARAFSSSSSPPGFFELRTDQVIPGKLNAYLDEYNHTAPERLKLLPGWLGMWKTELGGSVHSVQHLYQWNDYDQRDRARAAIEDHPMWLSNSEALNGGGADQDNLLPLPSLREKLSSSESVVMMEATDLLHSCGLPGAAGFTQAQSGDTSAISAPVTWELRQYQLVLGYATVPKFLALYGEGLADKLAADDSGASQLATLLYSDCGSLNVVVELWRHESMQRAQESRKASRQASKWKAAINEIAQISTRFETTYMRPLRASPWC